MTRIYLDEETRGHGYSGRKVYDSRVGYVSIGSTNANANVQPVIHANVTGLATVHGGRREIAEWKELTTDAARDDWMIQKVIGGLTVPMFQKLIAEAEERGWRCGAESARCELRRTLGLG